MTEPLSGSLTRVAGNLALDYVNTVSWRGTPHEVDHLGTVALLLSWLRASAAGERATVERAATERAAIEQAAIEIAPLAITRLQRNIRSDPASGPRFLQSALRLREAVGAVGAAVAAKTTPDSNALEIVKSFAAASLSGGRLVPRAGGSLGFDFRRAEPEAAVLGAIAWSAIDLMRSDQLPRLKRCPAADCRWLFLDNTRNGSRRWCDMATCGNRSKAKRFRRLADAAHRTAP